MQFGSYNTQTLTCTFATVKMCSLFVMMLLLASCTVVDAYTTSERKQHVRIAGQCVSNCMCANVDLVPAQKCIDILDCDTQYTNQTSYDLCIDRVSAAYRDWHVDKNVLIEVIVTAVDKGVSTGLLSVDEACARLQCSASHTTHAPDHDAFTKDVNAMTYQELKNAVMHLRSLHRDASSPSHAGGALDWLARQAHRAWAIWLSPASFAMGEVAKHWVDSPQFMPAVVGVLVATALAFCSWTWITTAARVRLANADREARMRERLADRETFAAMLAAARPPPQLPRPQPARLRLQMQVQRRLPLMAADGEPEHQVVDDGQ